MSQPKFHTRIERAVAFLEESAEDVRLEDVAAQVGMSAFHFSRLFTAAMGISPIAYQRRARLERAAGDLVALPDKPLVEIAFDAGFALPAELHSSLPPDVRPNSGYAKENQSGAHSIASATAPRASKGSSRSSRT